MMTTGMHLVRDIYCVGCMYPVGWKYVSGHEGFGGWGREKRETRSECLASAFECLWMVWFLRDARWVLLGGATQPPHDGIYLLLVGGGFAKSLALMVPYCVIRVLELVGTRRPLSFLSIRPIRPELEAGDRAGPKAQQRAIVGAVGYDFCGKRQLTSVLPARWLFCAGGSF